MKPDTSLKMPKSGKKMEKLPLFGPCLSREEILSASRNLHLALKKK